MMALAKAYEAMDASLAEINPFMLTKDGRVYALDAKISFDDNAMFRHKELVELRDLNEEDPLEVEASQVRPELHQAGWQRRLHGERRRSGDGDDGHHQVRGRQSGEFPRCRRRRERRTGRRTRFASCSRDRNVKAVLINIFGGILRCDTLATGVVDAARDLNIQVPIVVRMEGTNVELGRKILAESGLEFHGRRWHEGRGGEGREAGRAMRQ